MKTNLVDLIRNKTHESSLNKIKKQNIPEKLFEYLTIEFLTSISSTLSTITRQYFVYTGKVNVEKSSVVISFVSSVSNDEIKMIIQYGIDEYGGFDFNKNEDAVVVDSEGKEKLSNLQLDLEVIENNLDEQIEKEENERKKQEEEQAEFKSSVEQLITGLDEQIEKEQQEESKGNVEKLITVLDEQIEKDKKEIDINGLIKTLDEQIKKEATELVLVDEEKDNSKKKIDVEKLMETLEGNLEKEEEKVKKIEKEKKKKINKKMKAINEFLNQL